MRPSRMTCSGARCPAASRSWKSAGMLITISALPASIWLAIWSDEVSVAARVKTPAPSSRASSSVDAALRLWSSTA